MIRTLALSVTILASCTPKTFSEQAKYSLGTASATGHLGANFEPATGKEGAWSRQSAEQLVVSSASDEICFQRTTYRQHFPAHDTVESELAEWRKVAAGSTLVVEAHDSLASAAWPDKSTGVPANLADHRLEGKCPSGTSRCSDRDKSWRLQVVLAWCAPRPTTTASTKYLTASLFHGDRTPALFVWTFDAPPTPSAAVVEAPAEAALETKAPAPEIAADDGPVGPPVVGNLIEVMTAAKKYSTFLKLVDDAGLTDRLKAKGAYTVFAPDNQAFAREAAWFVPDLLKNKVTLAKMVRAHIARKAYTRAALTTGKRTDVATMTSPKEVTDNGEGHLILGNSKIHDDKPASNGVLWTIDSVMHN